MGSCTSIDTSSQNGKYISGKRRHIATRRVISPPSSLSHRHGQNERGNLVPISDVTEHNSFKHCFSQPPIPQERLRDPSSSQPAPFATDITGVNARPPRTVYPTNDCNDHISEQQQQQNPQQDENELHINVNHAKEVNNKDETSSNPSPVSKHLLHHHACRADLPLPNLHQEHPPVFIPIESTQNNDSVINAVSCGSTGDCLPQIRVRRDGHELQGGGGGGSVDDVEDPTLFPTNFSSSCTNTFQGTENT